MPLVEDLLAAWAENARRWEGLRNEIEGLGIRVFNPGIYAFRVYERFLRAFPPRRGALLVLGLNPGPAGMAQTGIPFTDCRTAASRLRLGLALPGCAPDDLLPLLRRPDGRFRLTYERSSLVVYRFLDHAFPDLETAYANWYVGNPCPLLFLEPDGENVTPADARLKRIPDVRLLREEAVERFARALRPRGIVTLGRDVHAAVGDVAERLVGAPNVVAWEHPARASPDGWARALRDELARRRLLAPS